MRYNFRATMNRPNADLQKLSDGNYLLTITQPGEPPSQLILGPQFAIFVGQLLTSTVLGRKQESDVVRLQAL